MLQNISTVGLQNLRQYTMSYNENSLQISDLISYLDGRGYQHALQSDMEETVSVGSIQLDSPDSTNAVKLSTTVTSDMCANILSQTEEQEVAHIYGLATLEEGLIVTYDGSTEYGHHEKMENKESIYVVIDINRGKRSDKVQITLVCLRTGEKITLQEQRPDNQLADKVTKSKNSDPHSFKSYFDKHTKSLNRDEKINKIYEYDKKSMELFNQVNYIEEKSYTGSKSLPIKYIPDRILIDVFGLESQVLAQKI